MSNYNREKLDPKTLSPRLLQTTGCPCSNDLLFSRIHLLIHLLHLMLHHLLIHLLNRSLNPKTPTTTAFSFQWDIRWRKIDSNCCQLYIYDNFDENSFDKSGLLSILGPLQILMPPGGDNIPGKFRQLGNNWPVICCGTITEFVLSFSWINQSSIFCDNID